MHEAADDDAHPHYDREASMMEPGVALPYERSALDLVCVRRSNRHFGFVRSWIHAPSSDKDNNGRTSRDKMFETRLFRTLPWYFGDDLRIACDVPCVGPGPAQVTAGIQK